MIYFIRNPGDGTVKIGCSTRPVDRLVQLQTGCAHKLELLGSIEGGLETEREIHAILASHQLQGEWFWWNDEVRAFVRFVFRLAREARERERLLLEAREGVSFLLGELVEAGNAPAMLLTELLK